jgi:hypothetical protein
LEASQTLLKVQLETIRYIFSAKQLLSGGVLDFIQAANKEKMGDLLDNR